MDIEQLFEIIDNLSIEELRKVIEFIDNMDD